MNRIIYFNILLLCISGAFPTVAQKRCGTVKYTELLKSRNQLPSNDAQFEQWLDNKKIQQRTFRNQRTSATYQIPVVVHVIHNGEALGTGTNIPDEQILSQIRVLNEDFNRLNADAGNTPAEFAAVAGSLDIEFVLAKQDPEGLATDGIVRVQGSQSSWTMDDNYKLKSQSYWPAEDYLNIWVCDITDFLGYAQFPESDLPGLENSSNNALTDGVVIWYRAFGSDDDGSFNLSGTFNKGRTTTHEVAHFFGLKHIWGDDGSSCTSGSDYVDDTPNQSGSSSGCPTHPKSSCGETTMFQNFLDYTDDECMNLFTQGQVDRMGIVLQNSPRRESLLTSPGLAEPAPVPNDLGIRTVISPTQTHCSTEVTPVIEVRNYGSNTVTSADISVIINGSTVEAKNVVLSLTNLESTEVTFDPRTLNAGMNELEFVVTLTNGVADGNPNNDTKALTVSIPSTIAIPFSENFNTLPSQWVIQNPDQQFGWQLKTASKETTDNKALAMNFFDYEDGFGEVDVFLSPVFDLSTVPVASLNFDVAHARFSTSADRLKVVVLTNCQELADGTVLYDKEGEALSTTGATSGPFTPSGAQDWRKEFLSLNPFIGQSHVQLAFVAINDWGNNLYLDNISVITIPFEDVALSGLFSPGIVTCERSPAPSILVQNLGIDVTSLTVEYSINDLPTQVLTISNFFFESGTDIEIALPEVQLIEGVNEIYVNLLKPNGNPDTIPDNNERQFTVVVSTAQNRIPLRENFDNEFTDEWTTVNPEGGMNWQTTATNYNRSMYFNAHNNTAIGDEAWLVSPVLDFSRTTSASLVYDRSYRRRPGLEENFRIYVSRDCGNTYDELSEPPLHFPEQVSAWAPNTEEHWEKNITINLSAYAGEDDVRVAFVVTNGNGNNLFLDNVEFFTTAFPDPIRIEEIYSIYGYNFTEPESANLRITFNLAERMDVLYTVTDAMGQAHVHGLLTDVLNQTYPLDLQPSLAPGVYVVRLKIGARYYAERILINR